MIVIDSDNYAASGIETLFFPGGEPHAKVPKLSGNVLLYLKLRTWNDVGLAACVQDALSIQANVHYVTNFIPYFPGARQDRTDGTAPLTVSVMNRLLTRHGTTKVFDMHNPAWTTPRDNFMPADLGLPMRPDVDFVVAPDKGAVDRAESFRKAYAPRAQLVCCTKERDPNTGKLSNYSFPDGCGYGKYLVVDDICDGGGTFILLAEAFRKYRTMSPLELFVSHGIFSKGFKALTEYYDHIYTTDSFHKSTSKPLWFTVYSLQPLVERLTND